jgi:uncharacterized protein YegL
MNDLPGGPISSRPLHFIWILDTSWSMEGEKIGQLNFAIKESLPAMQDTARENPTAEVLVRVVTFSSGARWHLAQSTPVDQFTWTDVVADGVTDMGKALSLVSEQLRMPPMTDRALPPVLVLITDGYPTDNFDAGLKALLGEPWGKRAVRLAIGMGGDTDMGVLAKFIGHNEIQPLRADNASTLIKYIKWASTVVVKSASTPLSRRVGEDQPTGGTPIPAPPPPTDGDEVW